MEQEQDLEAAADDLLSQQPPDQEYPIIPKSRRTRRREVAFCEDLAATDDRGARTAEDWSVLETQFKAADLSLHERVCLTLHAYLGFTDEEIQKLTGLSPRSIRSYRQSACRKVRSTAPIR